jgi:hypothetical protein
MKKLIKMWQERQNHYEDLAEKHRDNEHNCKKFTYKAMATRDCWKELLTEIEGDVLEKLERIIDRNRRKCS